MFKALLSRPKEFYWVDISVIADIFHCRTTRNAISKSIGKL